MLRVNFLEKFFVVIVLLLATGALGPLLRQEGGFEFDPTAGDPVLQAVWIGIYGMTFSLIIISRTSKIIAKIAIQERHLLYILGFVFLSILWSWGPGVTFRRSLALSGTTLFGMYLAARFSMKEQLRLLAWAFIVAAILSLIFAIFLPEYGVESGPNDGAWRGVYLQKNRLGRPMALSVCTFLLLALGCEKNRWIMWSCCGLSLGLVVLSASKTALGLLFFVLMLLPLYRALRRPLINVVPFFVGALLAGSGIAVWGWRNLDFVLELMDRDVGLSGRTELWGILFDMILWRPWLGYGYGGFWLGWEGASSSVWLSTGWDMLHAHNGFIDICLDLGVLGLTILLVGFWRNLVRAISFAQTAILEEELWPLIFLTFLFLYNFTESVFLVQHSIFWMFYVSLSFSMIYRSQFFYVGRDATVRDEQHRREYLAEAHHPYLS